MFQQYADQVSEKFDKPITVYLYNLVLNGFDDDVETVGGVVTSRLGRYLVHEDEQGFVASYRYPNRAIAELVMAALHDEAADMEE